MEKLADELKITTAMIDAGEDVLLGKLGGAVTVHWDARDMAEKVFRAMTESVDRPPKS